MSYKLLTYRADHGKARAGLLVGERVFDLATLSGNAAYATVLDVLNDWESAHVALKKFAAVATNQSTAGIPVSSTKLLAPIPNPGTVLCAGANYIDHAEEMSRVVKLRNGDADVRKEIDPKSIVGKDPWHFIKVRSTVTGPESQIAIPKQSSKLDWEVELVAVIGRTARNVPVAQALDYVAGYTITNDLSARDLGKRESIPDASPFKWDWVGHKCFDGSFPCGPWITPADEIQDPQQLALKLWVNDIVKQDSNTNKMIFSVAEQIAHLSSRVTLQPGDLIATGTPAGVGMARSEFLKTGDTVRMFIEKIGELSHTLV